MSATTAGRCGSVASTTAGSTGPTGSGSRATVRPFFSPVTAVRPWWTDGGTSSSATAHFNSRLTWADRRLAPPRLRPSRTAASRTAFSFFGPNSAAGVEPYSPRNAFSDCFSEDSSLVGSPFLT